MSVTAASREKFGPIWLYEPVISKNETIKHAIEKFIHTVLEGVTGPLLLHFVKNVKNTDELKQLRIIVDDMIEDSES